MKNQTSKTPLSIIKHPCSETIQPSRAHWRSQHGHICEAGITQLRVQGCTPQSKIGGWNTWQGLQIEVHIAHTQLLWFQHIPNGFNHRTIFVSEPLQPFDPKDFLANLQWFPSLSCLTASAATCGSLSRLRSASISATFSCFDDRNGKRRSGRITIGTPTPARSSEPCGMRADWLVAFGKDIAHIEILP